MYAAVLDGIDGAVEQLAGILLAFLLCFGQSSLQGLLLRGELLFLLTTELVIDLAPHCWIARFVWLLLPVLNVAFNKVEPQGASVFGNVGAVSFDFAQLFRVFDFLEYGLQYVEWDISDVDDQVDAPL